MLRFRERPLNPTEPSLATTYRFLRVNEATLTPIVCVRVECCGAKYYVHALGDDTVCVSCGREFVTDPRTAPLHVPSDKAHCVGAKVTRYVS